MSGSAFDDAFDEAHLDPPKSRRYRESDSSIKPMDYTLLKDRRSREIDADHKRKYSKYASDSDSEHRDGRAVQSPKSVRRSKIELSITREISAHSDSEIVAQIPALIPPPIHAQHGSALTMDSGRGSVLAVNTPRRSDFLDVTLHTPNEPKHELSNFYNKTTRDKYDAYEMNTNYSSDTDSAEPEANELVDKYKDFATPTPEPYPETESEAAIRRKRKKKRSKKKRRKKERLKILKKAKETETYTAEQFVSVDLSQFVESAKGDHFDIAKAICHFYDAQCGDTDTVAIVSEAGKGPNTAYWSKGEFNRVDRDCAGKYIMVYRACTAVKAQSVVPTDVFESCVRGLTVDNVHSQLIADKLDQLFGEGCHVSIASHSEFEVFCRYSNGYICESALPSQEFVVAWRR